MTRAAFAIGALLCVLSIAGFGVALKHASDVKAVEKRIVERGYPLEADVYELNNGRYSASRARGIAFLLLLGAGGAMFTGAVVGLPSKRRLEGDLEVQNALAESKAGRWDRWTRGRALASGVAITVSFVLGLGLWIVGSLRATRFTSSSFPSLPGEDLRGAVEFIVGTLLMIGAPTTVALLRRTTFWKWAAAFTAVVVGGLTAVFLVRWPPESSWSF